MRFWCAPAERSTPLFLHSIYPTVRTVRERYTLFPFPFPTQHFRWRAATPSVLASGTISRLVRSVAATGASVRRAAPPRAPRRHCVGSPAPRRASFTSLTRVAPPLHRPSGGCCRPPRRLLDGKSAAAGAEKNAIVEGVGSFCRFVLAPGFEGKDDGGSEPRARGRRRLRPRASSTLAAPRDAFKTRTWKKTFTPSPPSISRLTPPCIKCVCPLRSTPGWVLLRSSPRLFFSVHRRSWAGTTHDVRRVHARRRAGRRRLVFANNLTFGASVPEVRKSHEKTPPPPLLLIRFAPTWMGRHLVRGTPTWWS